jgi:hypothetical protein
MGIHQRLPGIGESSPQSGTHGTIIDESAIDEKEQS